MTDRVRSLTVVLDKDYRDDDCESIVEAVKMIKGVASVDMTVTEAADYINRAVVAGELRERLFYALRQNPDGSWMFELRETKD